MKTVVLLSLVLVSAALMGCTTDPCATDCCGQLNANCCGWEFYKPCRTTRRADCDPHCGTTRVVLTPCETGEAAPAEDAPMDAAPMEEAPSELAPADEPEEPAAEYGLPPAGR